MYNDHEMMKGSISRQLYFVTTYPTFRLDALVKMSDKLLSTKVVKRENLSSFHSTGATQWSLDNLHLLSETWSIQHNFKLPLCLFLQGLKHAFEQLTSMWTRTVPHIAYQHSGMQNLLGQVIGDTITSRDIWCGYVKYPSIFGAGVLKYQGVKFPMMPATSCSQ